jgi:DNA-binding MarR family transcriptional regulator
MQMSDLAARADASLSRLSHVVARLEQRGLVRREICGTDARATNAVLTQSGWDKVVATAPHHVQTVRSLVVEVLSRSQLQQFGRAAAKIGRRIEEQSGRANASE